MNAECTILVMAGAREAHGLVTALLARGRQLIASLPEPERMFGALPVPTRIGAFANRAEAATWLSSEGVRFVLDASHAFDDEICAPLRQAAQDLQLPYLRIVRPPWQPTLRDRWIIKPSIRDAVADIPTGARVFSNTGWASLPEFADFKGATLYLRHTGATARAAPFPFVDVVTGQPPFSQFEEEALFSRLGITHLICRNVGGAASMSKLLAARAVRIPVMMIERKPLADQVPLVENVADALAWEARVWS